MNTRCLLICVLALAAIGVSCRKPEQAQASPDDAKLRPEVAAALQGASPTPGAGDPAAQPSPSSSPR